MDAVYLALFAAMVGLSYALVHCFDVLAAEDRP
jgi:hypothetical protein